MSWTPATPTSTRPSPTRKGGGCACRGRWRIERHAGRAASIRSPRSRDQRPSGCSPNPASHGNERCAPASERPKHGRRRIGRDGRPVRAPDDGGPRGRGPEHRRCATARAHPRVRTRGVRGPVHATTSRHHREPCTGRREGSCDVSVVRPPRPGLAARESPTVSAPPLRGCVDSRPLVHLPYPVDERLRGDSANRTRKGDPDPRSGGFDPVGMNARAGKPVSTVGSASTDRMPTPVEPLSDFRAPRGERRLSAPHPGIGHRGWPPFEPRSTTHRPPPALTLGAPGPACYRRAGRVPDDVPATPWRSRP